MANEFKVKNALQILNTQPISGILNEPSIFNTNDASSLATVNATKLYAETTFVQNASLGTSLVYTGGVLDASIAAGGSAHLLKDTGTPFPARAAINFITNDTSIILSDDALGNETEITLKFLSLFDIDPTGVSDGDLFSYSSTTGKLSSISVAPYSDTLYSSEVLSADGLLSTIIPADYSIAGIRIAADGTTSAGTIDLGSAALGTDIVEGFVLTTTINEYAPIKDVYFSDVNDTDLYLTGLTLGYVTVYFRFEKGISSNGSMASKNFWTGYQATYDGLGVYDNNTIYFITV